MTSPTAKRLEFHPDEKGQFDELVARFDNGIVHLEMMNDMALYLGFYWDDGSECQVWIDSGKCLRIHHEHSILTGENQHV